MKLRELSVSEGLVLSDEGHRKIVHECCVSNSKISHPNIIVPLCTTKRVLLIFSILLHQLSISPLDCHNSSIMSNKIQLNDDATPVINASLLPMHIQYTGPAKTQDYFTPSKMKETRNDGTEIDIAYFRGCKLVGKTIDLKANDVGGYIVNRSEHLGRVGNEDGSEDIKSFATFTPTAKFDKLVLYGHDTTVELNNQWGLIPEFLEVSKIIHE